MALCPKLSPVLLVASCVTLSFLAFATPTQADTITSYTAGIAGNSTFFSGQSFTTPGTGPWDDITFNFFSSGGTPQAVGTLYLLTQPYAGTPAGLSGAVPGFLASTSSIVSNQWVFNPSVMLQSNTQYFAFMDSQTLINGSNSDAYSGGSAYLSSGETMPRS